MLLLFAFDIFLDDSLVFVKKKFSPQDHPHPETDDKNEGDKNVSVRQFYLDTPIKDAFLPFHIFEKFDGAPNQKSNPKVGNDADSVTKPFHFRNLSCDVCFLRRM
jgi:hypothetical protein